MTVGGRANSGVVVGRPGSDLMTDYRGRVLDWDEQTKAVAGS
jgi:hypothetical protein